ncbi:hypothetical protein TNCV_99181 [Trichonephila clavipes]|nr:hypothetical protein TNCV_99181 [Trichonephila clavipes]
MNKIWKTPTKLYCPTVLLVEFVVVDDDNVSIAPIRADRHFGVGLKLKNIFDADFDDENEMMLLFPHHPKRGTSAWALSAKLKSYVRSHITRAQVPPSGENTGRHNYLWRLVSAYLVPQVLASRECTRSVIVKHQSTAH